MQLPQRLAFSVGDETAIVFPPPQRKHFSWLLPFTRNMALPFVVDDIEQEVDYPFLVPDEPRLLVAVISTPGYRTNHHTSVEMGTAGALPWDQVPLNGAESIQVQSAISLSAVSRRSSVLNSSSQFEHRTGFSPLSTETCRQASPQLGH